MSPLDFFTDLLNPDLAFLPKALFVAVMSSIVCGVIGSYVVLRGMAFIGDTVAHAVFPGLAVAFVVSGNLVLGGTIAGILTAVLIAVFSQNRRLKEDSVIGVFFVAAFALGIVIISRAPGYAGSLQQFLFGSITGIPDSDLLVVGITGVSVIAVTLALHKELVTISLDRESARALGIPVFWLDLLLYVLVTLAVVISVQTIGNILVLALLITPAATARLLTDRLGVMMLLAPALGGLAAIIGMYVSWSWDLPTGGTIVLVLTATFLIAWVVSPRHGLLARLRRHPGTEEAVPTVPAIAGAVAAAGVGHTGAAALTNAAGEAATAEIPPVVHAAPTAPPTPAGPSSPTKRRWVLPAATILLAVLGAGVLTAAALANNDRRTDGPRSAPSMTPSAPSAPAAANAPDSSTATNPDDITTLADPAWVSSTARRTGIPERALTAYAGASLAVARTHTGCHLGWNTLAAIGEVESAHGSMNGARLAEDGSASPAIVGVPLDGSGEVAAVADTDAGRLDTDTRWDRAVGPMQFIPATWRIAAQDGDADGDEDVHDLDDAAFAAAIHLCENGRDLAVAADWISAVKAYNPSADYNNRVATAATRLGSEA